MDYVNRDSYTIFDDTTSVNQITTQNQYFTTNYSFYIQVNGGTSTQMTTENIYTSMPRSYLLPSVFHTLLFIKRMSRNSNQYFFSYQFTPDTTLNYTLINITSNSSYWLFSFPTISPTYDPYSTSPFVVNYISNIHLIYLRDAQPEVLVIGNYTYGTSMVTNVYVRDCDEPETVLFPALDHITVSPVSFVTFFVGLILLLTFVWHWWSVRYIVINSVIKECSPEPRYY